MQSGNDDIKITILEDGTIKTETDKIGQANHFNADQFLKEIQRMAGGATATVRKKASHVHTHGGVSHSH